MLSCFGPKAILRCPDIPGSEHLEDTGGANRARHEASASTLETVSLPSCTLHPQGNKDVPATPCRKRQLRRLPVSCAIHRPANRTVKERRL